MKEQFEPIILESNNPKEKKQADKIAEVFNWAINNTDDNLEAIGFIVNLAANLISNMYHLTRHSQISTPEKLFKSTCISIETACNKHLRRINTYGKQEAKEHQ